jgi:two-component system, OmpR family, response regulator MprA
MKSKLTVLIVEDDKDAREAFTEVLEEEGYEVAQAVDGREAEVYLSDKRPAAIVLDLMMPRLDGWAVASMMRQGRLPQVPIVVVTAATDHWGYPAPPNRVLKKPIDLQELLDAVRAVARSST